LSGKKLPRVYDMNSLSFLHKFLSDLLISGEEAASPVKNLKVP